jgi:hypothetical protein
MLIRFGYELAFNCTQPTLMVCLLDAHRDHAQNIRFETPFEITPAISTGTYFDTFGNSVRRFVAPPGDLTVCRDAILRIVAFPIRSSSMPKRWSAERHVNFYAR